MSKQRFKGIYRIETTRLRGYDYASAGWYHVVICTHERACVFGTVRGGVMGLSEVGMVAHRAWGDTLLRYPRAVPDAFVVMPNHVHAVVGFEPRDGGHANGGDANGGNADVETRRDASLPAGGGACSGRCARIPCRLSSTITRGA